MGTYKLLLLEVRRTYMQYVSRTVVQVNSVEVVSMRHNHFMIISLL